VANAQQIPNHPDVAEVRQHRRAHLAQWRGPCHVIALKLDGDAGPTVILRDGIRSGYGDRYYEMDSTVSLVALLDQVIHGTGADLIELLTCGYQAIPGPQGDDELTHVDSGRDG
jgi:hypothetical protein